MKNIAWTRIAGLALALFFLVGAIANVTASPAVIDDYARWGYPGGFHYVTGALELVAAILLAMDRTRLAGVALGLAIMGAAAATVLAHGEPDRVTPPAIVIAALLALGFALWKRRTS